MHKRKTEWLPWYRVRNYEGDLTEAEKRQLDAFRMQPSHPAAKIDDLPEEVRNLITRIHGSLYDCRMNWAVGRALFFSAIGAALIFANYYKGWLAAPMLSVLGALCLVWTGLWFHTQWKKISEEFLIGDYAEFPGGTDDEHIRREWEYIYNARSREAEQAREKRAT